MRILTNISKSKLDHLVNQPTAKAMIEKVKTEGIYIPEGDAQAAADFVATRAEQKRDTLQLSDEGRSSLDKELEEKEKTSQKEQIKKKIAELEKELAKINEQPAASEKAKAQNEKKADAIMQQISTLSMQLIQLQKNESDSNV